MTTVRDARPTSGAGAPSHLALRPIDLLGVGLAAAMIVVIAHAVNEQYDFTAFYSAVKAWRLGRPVPNAGPLDPNPPTFSVLFAPLTFLPLHGARVAWIVLRAAAAIDALRRIGRDCQLGARAMWWLCCACVALEPCVFA